MDVRDLPQDIVVSNVGLNGVLINETETTRTFTIEALPNARPGEQTIVVSGKVETRAAAQENTFAGRAHSRGRQGDNRRVTATAIPPT